MNSRRNPQRPGSAALTPLSKSRILGQDSYDTIKNKERGHFIMKKTKALSLILAAAMTASLMTGCSSSNTASTAESSTEETTAEETTTAADSESTAEETTAADMSFDFSAGLTDEGMFDGVTALDFAVLPAYSGIEIDLENNGNNTGLAVEVSDCQRDSLSIFVYAKNNKLTGFCLAGHMRGLDVQQSDCRVELSSSYNLVHVRHTFLCIFVLLPPGSNTYAGNLPAQCSSFIL